MEWLTVYIRDKNQIDHAIQIPNEASYSLMELLKASELPILGTCGGMALCASCHIYVHSENILPGMNDAEELLLDSLVNSQTNSRLSCQIPVGDYLDQLIIEIADQ